VEHFLAGLMLFFLWEEKIRENRELKFVPMEDSKGHARFSFFIFFYPFSSSLLSPSLAFFFKNGK